MEFYYVLTGDINLSEPWAYKSWLIVSVISAGSLSFSFTVKVTSEDQLLTFWRVTFIREFFQLSNAELNVSQWHL